jgi:hypothetical protein
MDSYSKWLSKVACLDKIMGWVGGGDGCSQNVICEIVTQDSLSSLISRRIRCESWKR